MTERIAKLERINEKTVDEKKANELNFSSQMQQKIQELDEERGKHKADDA